MFFDVWYMFETISRYKILRYLTILFLDIMYNKCYIHVMRLMAENKENGLECYLLEKDDLNDPKDVEVMLAGRFLDFPYTVSETVRAQGVKILSELLEDPDLENFILWDRKTQSVIGRSKTKNLQCAAHDMPEITELYIEQKERGRHAVDTLYAGQFLAANESGFATVKVLIDHHNDRSLKAAIRNGFSAYSPIDGPAPGAYNLRRSVVTFTPNQNDNETHLNTVAVAAHS